MAAARFEFRYTPVWRWLLVLCGTGPRRSWVEVGDGQLRVRLGWAFRMDAPRASVRRAEAVHSHWYSVGVHTNFRGDWLVNGSMKGLVSVEFDPRPDARSVFRVNPRRVILSLEDPAGFLGALGFPPAASA